MALKEKKRAKTTRRKNVKSVVTSQNNNRRMITRSCTNIGKKRIELESEEEKSNNLHQHEFVVRSTYPVTSPIRNNMQKEVFESIHQRIPGTPKTPAKVEFESQSKLESLPIELLVKILCNLHHDQLRSVFHVSERMRCAVLEARQLHFNYTTPDRSRQEILMTMTPVPMDHWIFIRGDGNVTAQRNHQALTPKAPRQGPRRPRLHLMDLKQISSALFQESTLPSKFKVPPGLPRPVYKPMASPRVLFYEDDLC